MRELTQHILQLRQGTRHSGSAHACSSGWWQWDLPAAARQPASLALLVTAAQPCASFRVFVDAGGRLREMTAETLPLPPMAEALRPEVQDRRRVYCWEVRPAFVQQDP